MGTPTKGFFMSNLSISESLIKSKELTIKEKGCFIYLLTLPEDQVYSYKKLSKNLPDNFNSIRHTIRSLIDKGFIVVREVKNENKKIINRQYLIGFDGKLFKCLTMEYSGE